MRNYSLFVWAIVALGLSGCIGGGLYTARYRPESDTEAKLLEVARNDIFPQDIRTCPAQHTDEKVVWTGVVTHRKVRSAEDVWAVDLTVEHHYWDWLIDSGHALLSNRGEGSFALTLDKLREEPDDDWLEPGAMVIAYGEPTWKEGELRLKPVYVRGIAEGDYGIFAINYGRSFIEDPAGVKLNCK